jgi:hypothetical protein
METFALTHLMLAGVLANLPFAPREWRVGKRALALLGTYALWMAAAMLALWLDGQAPTPWELWPVTVALFAVISFPGIVLRYLRT